jgi:hypothetical protein
MKEYCLPLELAPLSISLEVIFPLHMIPYSMIVTRPTKMSVGMNSERRSKS